MDYNEAGGAWLAQLSEKTGLEEVLKTNDTAETFGLTLSEEEARLLCAERKEALKEEQRVEFGAGILPKLILRFCGSPFLLPENYAEMLGRLQEIFYVYKNESLDELTDDELLDFMKEKFDGECEGDLEYLEGTALEEFARSVRARTGKYFGGSEWRKKG